MAENIEGKVFGHLTVLEYDKEKKKWKCQCDCGSITYVATRNLKTGNTKSCGCQKNAVGKKRPRKGNDMLLTNPIGQIRVLSIDEKNNIAKCFCLECGKKSELPLDKVKEMYKSRKRSYTCGQNGCSYTRKTKNNKSFGKINKGDRFGNLTVIDRSENKIYKTNKSFSSVPMFLCQCDCGNKVTIQGRYLLGGRTKSCGCQKSKNFKSKNSYNDITSTESGKQIYKIYKNWKSKFSNPTALFKRKVIDGGIKFFPELEGKEKPFELFYQWAIINGFSKDNKFLERKNYLEDFSSKNCFWTNIKTKGY